MKRNILQVPVSSALQLSAKRAAAKQGFSSLQDAVRVFLQQLASGATKMRLMSTDEEALSPAAQRRHAKIIEDIKKGKNVTKTENIDELLKLLYA